jgi:hypothetical protein
MKKATKRGFCDRCSHRGRVRLDANCGQYVCTSCERQLTLFSPAELAVARVMAGRRLK